LAEAGRAVRAEAGQCHAAERGYKGQNAPLGASAKGCGGFRDRRQTADLHVFYRSRASKVASATRWMQVLERLVQPSASAQSVIRERLDRTQEGRRFESG
jgi:hypothetical protein